jgi:hypothetical protein
VPRAHLRQAEWSGVGVGPRADQPQIMDDRPAPRGRRHRWWSRHPRSRSGVEGEDRGGWRRRAHRQRQLGDWVSGRRRQARPRSRVSGPPSWGGEEGVGEREMLRGGLPAPGRRRHRPEPGEEGGGGCDREVWCCGAREGGGGREGGRKGREGGWAVTSAVGREPPSRPRDGALFTGCSATKCCETMWSPSRGSLSK